MDREAYAKTRTAILLEVCQRTGNRGDAAAKAFDAAIEFAERHIAEYVKKQDNAAGEIYPIGWEIEEGRWRQDEDLRDTVPPGEGVLAIDREVPELELTNEVRDLIEKAEGNA
jgi:hypothetical protein